MEIVNDLSTMIDEDPRLDGLTLGYNDIRFVEQTLDRLALQMLLWFKGADNGLKPVVTFSVRGLKTIEARTKLKYKRWEIENSTRSWRSNKVDEGKEVTTTEFVKGNKGNEYKDTSVRVEQKLEIQPSILGKEESSASLTVEIKGNKANINIKEDRNITLNMDELLSSFKPVVEDNHRKTDNGETLNQLKMKNVELMVKLNDEEIRHKRTREELEKLKAPVKESSIPVSSTVSESKQLKEEVLKLKRDLSEEKRVCRESQTFLLNTQREMEQIRMQLAAYKSISQMCKGVLDELVETHNNYSLKNKAVFEQAVKIFEKIKNLKLFFDDEFKEYT
jgi:hypothetical protein